MAKAEASNYGTLYICATPIGNLGDISLRVLETLKNADIIAAEDTRHTLKLLNRYEIKKKLISCHEHNEKARSHELVSMLKEGQDIALVSDAGMPGISDPGGHLISECINAGINITSCPGASASITALVLSGLSSGRFVFEGFLPRASKERRQLLSLLKSESRTIILYEAPHRLIKTLSDIYEYMGDRRISVCRELTKAHEEVLRTTVSGAIEVFSNRDIKGEIVIVIEGADISAPVKSFSEEDITESVAQYVKDGLKEMDAIKKTAKDMGVPKRIIYEAVKCKTL